MSLYERTVVQTVDEDDIGREFRLYDAKLGDGTTIAMISLSLPSVTAFHGQLADLLPLAADRTSLRALLVKAVRRHLTNSGLTIKP